ncbi:MAG: Phosphoribosylformylglycinamidine synthase 2, partial [Thermotoga petrophila]
QYDYMVGTDTIITPGSGAALMRIKGTKVGYALTVHSRADLADIDPYWGTYIAVIEAARKIRAVGGRPLGITNGVNYGDPDIDPMRLAGVFLGLKRGAEELRIPVVSGNASLYNTFKGIAIPPTLIVGMLGKVEDIEKIPLRFKPSTLYAMGWPDFDPRREELLLRTIDYCLSKGYRVYSSSRLITETLKRKIEKEGLSLEIRKMPKLNKAHQMILVFADEPIETLAPPVMEVGRVC